MKVAAVQFQPVLYDKEGNLRRLLDLLEEALSGGARIVVLPEMATTGYCFHDRGDLGDLPEPLPGPTTRAVQAVCGAHGGVAVFGLPEEDETTGVFYNSVAVVGEEGLLGRYRKIHSFISEPRWAMDGDLGHVVVKTAFGRIGLLDCADIELFEGARALQILGADLIAFPTAWCGSPAPSEYWWARAWETGLPLIAADRIGVERGVHFAGGSAIFSGGGDLLATRDDGEGIVFADIGPPQALARQAPLPPREYLPLARDTHRFHSDAFFNLYGEPGLPPGGRLRVSALPWRGDALELSRALEAVRGGVVVLPQDGLRDRWRGETVGELSALCRAQGTWIAAGSAETGDLALVGPEGRMLSRAAGARGTEGSIANLPGARVGLCRGEELALPETSRLFALEGVDLLLVPDRGEVFAPGAFPGSAVALEDGPTPPQGAYYFIPRVRAESDDLYIAYASADLPCAVLQPAKGTGEVSRSGAEGVVVTRPGAHGAPEVRRKPHLRRRRPEHYTPLWTPRET